MSNPNKKSKRHWREKLTIQKRPIQSPPSRTLFPGENLLSDFVGWPLCAWRQIYGTPWRDQHFTPKIMARMADGNLDNQKDLSDVMCWVVPPSHVANEGLFTGILGRGTTQVMWALNTSDWFVAFSPPLKPWIPFVSLFFWDDYGICSLPFILFLRIREIKRPCVNVRWTNAKKKKSWLKGAIDVYERFYCCYSLW